MTHEELIYKQAYKLFLDLGYGHASSHHVAEIACMFFSQGLNNKAAIDRAIKEGKKHHLKLAT